MHPTVIPLALSVLAIRLLVFLAPVEDKSSTWAFRYALGGGDAQRNAVAWLSKCGGRRKVCVTGKSQTCARTHRLFSLSRMISWVIIYLRLHSSGPGHDPSFVRSTFLSCELFCVNLIDIWHLVWQSNVTSMKYSMLLYAKQFYLAFAARCMIEYP